MDIKDTPYSGIDRPSHKGGKKKRKKYGWIVVADCVPSTSSSSSTPSTPSTPASSATSATETAVNWLDGWGQLDFSDLTDIEEIEDRKTNIEIWVRGLLSQLNALALTNYVISIIDWEVAVSAPLSYTLNVYLTPPAVKTGGGTGGGSISPSQPPKPPPPTL